MATGADDGGPGLLEKRFGIVGPLLATALCTIALFVLVWLMTAMLSFFYVPELSTMKDFLASNIPYLAIFVLLLSYASYAAKMNRKAAFLFPPAMLAGSVLVLIWLLSESVLMIPLLSQGLVGTYITYVKDSMYLITLALLLAGYVFVISAGIVRGSMFGKTSKPKPTGESEPKATPSQPSAIMAKPSIDAQRNEAKQLMKQAERNYLNRKIDRETFDKIAQDYQRKMTELDAKEATGRN